MPTTVSPTVRHVNRTATRRLGRQPSLARDLRRAAYIIAPAALVILPAALVILPATAVLARSGHGATAVAWLAAALVAAVAVAYAFAEPHQVARARRAAHRWASLLQQFAHIALWCAAGMFVVVVLMRWILTDTGVLAVASRAMPATPGGIGRESLNAANASQILDMLTAALPALMILLITAGALRPARSTR